jgi:hypothetical protein
MTSRTTEAALGALLLAILLVIVPTRLCADKAPTLEETLEWIQLTVDGAEHQVDEWCPSFLSSTNFSWKGCVVTWKLNFRSGSRCDNSWETRTISVNLGDLDPGSVSLPDLPNDSWLVVKTYQKRETIKYVVVGFDAEDWGDYSETYTRSDAGMVVPKSRGLRVAKAMHHAVELCGGKRWEEVF